jgi:hypothetical protein
MSDIFDKEFADYVAKNNQQVALKTIDGKPVGSVQTVDPDTIKVNGQSSRIQGFNSPETAHIRGGMFIPGQYVNDTSQKDISALSILGNFDIGKVNGKDKYNRNLLEIQNKTGASLGDTATKLGLQEITPFSNPEAVKQGMNIQAAQGIFPSLAKSDPMLALAMQRKKESEARGETYIPKINTNTEAEYAGFKRDVGVAAVAELEKEINRLENILMDPSLKPETRKNLNIKLEEAQNKIFRAGTTPDYIGGVNLRRDDRNIMNQANSQLGTSWDNAALDIQKMVGGILQITGDQTKWEWLSNKANNSVKRIKTEQADLPETLSSFHDIRTDNSWNTIKDTATFLGNTFVGTVPLIATMVAANYATGGMGGMLGFGMSSLPGSMLYTGGYYADQPDDKKNPGLAIAMGIPSGILDNLGLHGMVMKNQMFTIAGKKEVIDAMMKQELPNGVKKFPTMQSAEEALNVATKKEIVAFSEIGAEFARKQIASKEAIARTMGSLAINAGSESVTEGIQQAAEQLATTGVWSTDVQYEKDFYKQILDAAVGGAAMGATFNSIGRARDFAQWHSLADSQREYNRLMTQSQIVNSANQIKLESNQGGFESIGDAADKTKLNNIPSTRFGVVNNLNQLPAKEGSWNGIKSIITDPFRLFRQHADTTVRDIVDENGNILENKSVLKAIMGGFGILPGNSYSTDKRLMMGRWGGVNQDTLASKIGLDVNTTNKYIRDAWVNYWSQGKVLPLDNTVNQELQMWFNEEEKTRQKMYDAAIKNGLPTDDIKDLKSMFEASSYDYNTLSSNRELVIQEAVNAGGNRADVNKAVDFLLSKDPNKVKLARAELSKYGVFTNPKLQDIFENNIFTVISNLKDSLSNQIVQKRYLGENGEVLAKLLSRAWDNGEFGTDEDAFQDAVKNTRDWYEMVTGTYHTMDDSPRLKKVISWGTTLTMLASLSKAALSSQTEVALATLGTPADLINKQLGSYVDNLMSEIGSDVNKFNSWSLSSIGIAKMRNVPSQKLQKEIDILQEKLNNASPEESQKILDKINSLNKKLFNTDLYTALGYNETGYNTQSKFEYTDVNQRQAMHVFATIIGLRAQTDATRMAVLSIASDVVVGMLSSLRQVPLDKRQLAFATGEGLNNEQGQSLLALQQYGMDVPFVISVLDNAQLLPEDVFTQRFLEGETDNVQAKRLQDNIYTTLANFVDSRAVNPQAFNMPKYFSDPRLRVITAMGRFIAAAHNVILPRLYRQFILNGNVAMRYQAFSTIAMALIFAALANALKDRLSYGDESPYVKGYRKNIQRTINSSGLLGQFERITDNILPVYPQPKTDITQDPLKWTVNKVKDISPVASWAARPVEAAMYFSEDKPAAAVKQLARATPVIGSFPIAADFLSSVFKENK